MIRQVALEGLELNPYDFGIDQKVSGHPVQRMAVLKGESGPKLVHGVWDCTQGEFTIDFTWEESAFILEGEVMVSFASGDRVFLKKGDLVHFPKGTVCRWEIPAYIKKVFTAL